MLYLIFLHEHHKHNADKTPGSDHVISSNQLCFNHLMLAKIGVRIDDVARDRFVTRDAMSSAGWEIKNGEPSELKVFLWFHGSSTFSEAVSCEFVVLVHERGETTTPEAYRDTRSRVCPIYVAVFAWWDPSLVAALGAVLPSELADRREDLLTPETRRDCEV